MDSLFDLTYKIFENRIFNIVLRYMGKYIAANGNVPDHRRIAFPKEVELLRLIGEEFAEQCQRQSKNVDLWQLNFACLRHGVAERLVENVFCMKSLDI